MRAFTVPTGNDWFRGINATKRADGFFDKVGRVAFSAKLLDVRPDDEMSLLSRRGMRVGSAFHASGNLFKIGLGPNLKLLRIHRLGIA